MTSEERILAKLDEHGEKLAAMSASLAVLEQILTTLSHDLSGVSETADASSKTVARHVVYWRIVSWFLGGGVGVGGVAAILRLLS
jgi:hypothetical protein